MSERSAPIPTPDPFAGPPAVPHGWLKPWWLVVWDAAVAEWEAERRGAPCTSTK